MARFRIAKFDPWVDDINDARRFYTRHEASDWVIYELHRQLHALGSLASSSYGVAQLKRDALSAMVARLKVVREPRPLGATKKAKLSSKFFDETVAFPPLHTSVGIDMGRPDGDETVMTIVKDGKVVSSEVLPRDVKKWPGSLVTDLRILRGMGKRKSRDL